MPPFAVTFKIDVYSQVLVGTKIVDDLASLLAMNHVCIEPAWSFCPKFPNPCDGFSPM